MPEEIDDTQKFDAEKKYTSRFLLWISAFLIFAALIFFFCLIFLPIPSANTSYAQTILGFVAGTMVSPMINFYWGSSKSSRDKDNSISTLAKSKDDVNQILKKL